MLQDNLNRQRFARRKQSLKGETHQRAFLLGSPQLPPKRLLQEEGLFVPTYVPRYTKVWLSFPSARFMFTTSSLVLFGTFPPPPLFCRCAIAAAATNNNGGSVREKGLCCLRSKTAAEAIPKGNVGGDMYGTCFELTILYNEAQAQKI